MLEVIKAINEHNNSPVTHSLTELLKNTRLDERRNMGTLMSVKFELLAPHIRNAGLTASEVADLLNVESEKIRNEALDHDYV